MLSWTRPGIILVFCALRCSQVKGMPNLVVDPAEIASAAVPAAQTYADWNDWEGWNASQDVVQALVRYRSGYDLDGLVVHVAEFGNLDARKWAAEPKEKQDEFWKYYEQGSRLQEKDAAMNDNQGIVLILDFDGFTLKHFASKDAIKFGLKLMPLLIRENGIVKYGFFINVNFAAETWLDLTRPFTGDMLSRFETFGTKSEAWKPKLLRHIPASSLPPKYGGSKDWKPL